MFFSKKNAARIIVSASVLSLVFLFQNFSSSSLLTSTYTRIDARTIQLNYEIPYSLIIPKIIQGVASGRQTIDSKMTEGIVKALDVRTYTVDVTCSFRAAASGARGGGYTAPASTKTFRLFTQVPKAQLDTTIYLPRRTCARGSCQGYTPPSCETALNWSYKTIEHKNIVPVYKAGEYPFAPQSLDVNYDGGISLQLIKEQNYYPSIYAPDSKTIQKMIVRYKDKKEVKSIAFDVQKLVVQSPLRLNKSLLGSDTLTPNSSSNYLGQQTMRITSISGTPAVEICTYHPGLTVFVPRTDGKYTYYFKSNHVISDFSSSADFNITLGKISMDGISFCSMIYMTVDNGVMRFKMADEIASPEFHNIQISGASFQIEDVIGSFGGAILKTLTGGLWGAIEKQIYKAINSTIDIKIKNQLQVWTSKAKNSTTGTSQGTLIDGLLQKTMAKAKGEEIASYNVNNVINVTDKAVNSATQWISSQSAINISRYQQSVCEVAAQFSNASQPNKMNSCLKTLLQNVQIKFMPIQLNTQSGNMGCYSRPVVVSDASHWLQIPKNFKDSCSISVKVQVSVHAQAPIVVAQLLDHPAINSFSLSQIDIAEIKQKAALIFRQYPDLADFLIKK